MKLNKLIFAVTVILSGATYAAVPTSGAYITDPQNEYVQDKTLDQVNSVNAIMCIMKNLRADAKVNTGNYIALIDINKCSSSQQGSAGDSTSSGAMASSQYITAVVNSTRASNTSPMLVKAWLTMVETSVQKTIYIDTTVTEAPSTNSINGKFTMEYAVYAANLDSSKSTIGRLSADGSTVSFYEKDSTGTTDQTIQLTLTQNGTTSGSGRINVLGTTISDDLFAYNSSHFKRGTTNSNQCFDRDHTKASYSTWRYGVYTSTGDRFKVSNPGFAISYTPAAGGQLSGTKFYGNANFWGLYLNNDALLALQDETTPQVTRPSDSATLNYSHVGGKLSKLTKVTTTLESIKGLPIRVRLKDGSATGTEYEIVWNGTSFKKVRKFTYSQGVQSSETTTEDVIGYLLARAGQNILVGYAPSIGGNVSISVGATGNFGSVVYRTRTTVTPSEAAGLTLTCVSECPANTIAMNNTNRTFFQLVNNNEYNWSPVPLTLGIMNSSVPITYTFNNDGIMHYDDGTNVDASSITDLTGAVKYGVQSGQLVNSDDLPTVKCNENGAPNGSGMYICPSLFDQVTDLYQYETGPNTWNQYQGLSPIGSNSPITFDPPTKLSLLISRDTTTLPLNDQKLNSTAVLDFIGFGDLQGISGTCINPLTNDTGACGSTYTRWVPEYSIKDGSPLTNGTQTYYVKSLDRELRLAIVDGTNCTTLTLPSAATLPTAPTINPKANIGATIPTVTAPPSVIHGVLQ